MLRSEEQIDFIKAGIAYVTERNYTYYIGVQMTSINYCPSSDNVHDSGNIFQIFDILDTTLLDQLTVILVFYHIFRKLPCGN